MMIEYKLIKMKRKSVSLTIDNNLCVVVKSPRGVSKDFLDDFVMRHAEWIEEAKRRKMVKNSVFNDENRTKELTLNGQKYISERLPYYSALTGFVPISWGITRAKTRFGSCSGKNRINFSCYLFAYPPDAIDYVILHELCHIKYKNHSNAFYAEIEKYMPDYKQRKELLKTPPKI